MNQYKKRLDQLLELTIREKRGMLAFLVLIVLINGSKEVYHRFFEKEIQLEKIANKVDHLRMDSLRTRTVENRQPSLTSFDPNTCSEGTFLDMGFSDVIAKRIIKYREAGGKFFHSDDMKKIYGLDQDHFDQIRAYVHIPSYSASRNANELSIIKRKPIEKRKIEPRMFDLNKADSLEFIRIRGIGPVYASRIVKYRDILGGFVHKEQVKEVYGIRDSLYEKIQGQLYVDSVIAIKRIPINTITKKELGRHPYFRSYSLCRGIVNYRNQHGSYTSIQDLRGLHLMVDSLLEKVAPYLSYD